MAAEEARNWADMPLDSILAVLHKLDHIDILMAADQVCRSWRRAARDEPELWRRIVMRGNAELSPKLIRQGMACEAVRRSAGQCEAFCGEHAADDGFLLYLSEQAPCLKSLRLISCSGVSKEGFEDIIKGFPLLEELELSLHHNQHQRVYKVIVEACPQLKHFRLNKQYFNGQQWTWQKDMDALGIATMHELRSVQLFANSLTNKGLATILDNCPHLESLDIRHCFNVDIDNDDDGPLLRGNCAGIGMLRLPHDSTHDYDLEVGSPRFASEYQYEYLDWCSSPDVDRYWIGEESEDDNDDYYSGSSLFEADLDKYETVLPRRLRK